jgi:hypothetical protein
MILTAWSCQRPSSPGVEAILGLEAASRPPQKVFPGQKPGKTLTCLAAKFSMARIPVFEEMNAKYA